MPAKGLEAIHYSINPTLPHVLTARIARFSMRHLFFSNFQTIDDCLSSSLCLSLTHNSILRQPVSFVFKDEKDIVIVSSWEDESNKVMKETIEEMDVNKTRTNLAFRKNTWSNRFHGL